MADSKAPALRIEGTIRLGPRTIHNFNPNKLYGPTNPFKAHVVLELEGLQKTPKQK